MILLSVDIGWKNLAFALFEDGALKEWKVITLLHEDINVNKTSIEVLVNHVSAKLADVISGWSKVSVALLESQPMGVASRNVKTKVLSHVIQSHLVGLCIPVTFVSPKLKIRDMPEVGTYAQNKKFAIKETERIIKERFESWLPLFLASKKKDDLADCFMQAINGPITINNTV